jgi:hypothetical protein
MGPPLFLSGAGPVKKQFFLKKSQNLLFLWLEAAATSDL